VLVTRIMRIRSCTCKQRPTCEGKVLDNLIIRLEKVYNLDIQELATNDRRQVIVLVLLQGPRVGQGFGKPGPGNVVASHYTALVL